jgi:23S rRNA (adenine-N6)-dimethyltransferase
MRTRSLHGGRHELGQNFLIHRPTIDTIVGLVAETDGPILEIGAGDGALTLPLARLGRPLQAIDLDEHRVARLRRRLPGVDVRYADALRHPVDRPVVVGNLPFHLTTPLLRRLLDARAWRNAIVLTQWEVARKRAGGGTMMTAQAAPWFEFELHGRVPAAGFRPQPSVDGGILALRRRASPLVAEGGRASYERFVSAAFTARGRGLAEMLQSAGRADPHRVGDALCQAGVDPHRLPRDLDAAQWVALWGALVDDPSGGHGGSGGRGGRGGSGGGRPATGRRTSGRRIR